jgi:hypothetical protein
MAIMYWTQCALLACDCFVADEQAPQQEAQLTALQARIRFVD